MDLGLKGKTAMVAAATRGIGLAAARALAAEGAKVSVCGLDEGRVAAAAKALGAPHKAYRCDLSSAAEIEAWHRATVKDLGAPSILVTNTGGPPAGPIGSLTDLQWQKGFENTLLNVVRLTALASPAMKAAKWGRIVHVTSLVAKDPEPLLPISSTLRAGLMAMTKLQAKELAPFGVTVNGLLPGHTETDRQAHLLEVRAQKSGATVEEEKRRAVAHIPAGRMAAASEMGDVIAFLCSERAAYLSGQSIAVDGALSGGLG
jgi:3-oxoacyl-[acyl-carrier protein] reductase